MVRRVLLPMGHPLLLTIGGWVYEASVKQSFQDEHAYP